MSKKYQRREADPDLVVVAEADMTEALMIVERLRSLDIPAVVKGETYLSLVVGPMVRTSVLVPRAYYDQAEAILRPDMTAPPDDIDIW
jgi:hypothetical protein